MFRDDNDEFMKSFGVDKSSSSSNSSLGQQQQLPNYRPSKKVQKYCENLEFTMVQEKSESKESFSEQVLKKQDEQEPAIEVATPKRINWIKESMMHSRKFSDANMVVSIKRYDELELGNSNPRYSRGQEGDEVESQVFEEVRGLEYEGCGPQNRQVEPAEQDPEVYYMKKVRLLQTKFKQLNILYENQIMQLKKDKKCLQDEVTLYQSYIEKYLPTLKEEISEKLQEQRERVTFLSSSSDQSQNESMTVISQIMEIKIQGKKLCDEVKTMEVKIKELQRSNAYLCEKMKLESNSVMTAENTEKNPSPLPPKITRKNSIMRKYSIPGQCGRYKKLSFQTTIISDKSMGPQEKKQPQLAVQRGTVVNQPIQ